MALLAMRMPSDLGSSGLGSVQQRKQIWFSQELENEKSRFSLCLDKRKLLKEYYNTNK